MMLLGFAGLAYVGIRKARALIGNLDRLIANRYLKAVFGRPFFVARLPRLETRPLATPYSILAIVSRANPAGEGSLKA